MNTRRKIHTRSVRACLFGTAALCSVPAAWAQDAASDTAGGLAEVIVTAQRYEESEQRAPIIIQTITAEDLQSITDVRDLQNAVPGVQMSNGGAYIQTYVRGIGSFVAKAANESPVAYSVDGIYLYSTTQVSPALYDLARVEVLKGPQGTLYGRNASGGAINLITQGAKLGSFEGYGSGELGNYDLWRIEGALNLPVSDTFALRVAAQHLEHDGYLSDGTYDDDTTSGRIRTLWEPSADVSLKLNFDAARVRGKGPGVVVFPFLDKDDPWIGLLDPRADTGITALSAFRPLVQPRNDLDQWSGSAQLDWNLGLATLTVLPAYRHEKIDSVHYVSGQHITDDSTVEQRSFEARLADQSDRLRWVVGAYYFDVDSDQFFTVSSPFPAAGRPTVHIQDNPVGVTSWAVFGETTYNLTDSLRLIGGLRYTWERTVHSGTQNRIFPTPPNTTAYLLGIESGDFSLDRRVSDNAVTWKVGAQYDVTPQSMLFATVSRGFKGGTIFIDAPNADATADPEYVTAYELGSRNRFFDNSLQLNLELFYWDIKDQQISFAGFNNLNQANFQTTNAATAEVYGANVDVSWLATAHDRFHVGIEYLHSQYDRFVRVTPVASVGTVCGTTLLSAGPPPRFEMDCSGLRMVGSPKWAGSAGYEHRFDLANGGAVTVGADMTFVTSRWATIDFSSVTRDSGYELFNAEVGYHAPNDRWSLSAWGQNLSNEAFVTGGVQTANFSRLTVNQPRTYGVRARMNF